MVSKEKGLTLGRLRKAMEGLPDETIVQIPGWHSDYRFQAAHDCWQGPAFRHDWAWKQTEDGPGLFPVNERPLPEGEYPYFYIDPDAPQEDEED